MIKQKFQPMQKNSILQLVSGGTEYLIGTEVKSKNTISPHSKIQGIKYINLKDTIYGFGRLEKNWDSFNADAISNISINTAIEALDHLNLKGYLNIDFIVYAFPMRDGGIQFEIEGENISAEIEISPEGIPTFILFNNGGDIIEKERVFELLEISTLLEVAQNG